MLHSLEVIKLPDTSDHNLISFATEFRSQTRSIPGPDDRPDISKFNFNRANVPKMKDALRNANLAKIVEDAETTKQAKSNLISEIVRCAHAVEIPFFAEKRSVDTKTPEVKKLFRQRTKLLKSIREATNSYQQSEIQNRLNAINASINQHYQTLNEEVERKHVANIKLNPKNFYRYAKMSRVVQNKIGPLKCPGSNSQFDNDPKAMAEILSNQYRRVFSTPKEYPYTLKLAPHPITLTDIEYQNSDIKKATLDIPSSSSPGPDGTTPDFLKTYIDELVGAISKLWRRSLDDGDMPDDVHLAYISPIFKSGDKSDPANNRPISLTNHLTKIFERVLKDVIVRHLAESQLLNETQHGFRSGRSCMTNLIEYYESILLHLQHNRSVDSIYLDFSKAFDKCDHGIILQKVSALGIGGKVYNWLESFLRNRKQIVVIDGHRSDPVCVLSGVPQGSVLGPLLFLILMYDITVGLNNSILSSFADDTKIWRGISIDQDVTQLQGDLELIYKWAEENNMLFNGDKFAAIEFGNVLTANHYGASGGEPISIVKTVKDLGIHISDDLSFEHHIRLVVKKGNRMAGWIMRVFKNRTKALLIQLLKQLIYPISEYGSILWSPTQKHLIALLETVQRHYTARIQIDGDEELDYWDRLRVFKLYSMERRRERYIIFYCWKVLHGIYPNPGLHHNTMFSTLHTDHQVQGIGVGLTDRRGLTLHHDEQQDIPNWLKGKSLLARYCKLFNSIPSQLLMPVEEENQPTFKSFKTSLDKWLATIPDQPAMQNRQRAAISNSILDQKNYIR